MLYYYIEGEKHYLFTHGILNENSVTRHSSNDFTSGCFRVEEANVLSQYCFQVQTSNAGRLSFSSNHPTGHLCNTAREQLKLNYHATSELTEISPDHMQCMKMHTLKKANNNYKHNQVVVQSRGILLIVSFQICRNHKKERKKEKIPIPSSKH